MLRADAPCAEAECAPETHSGSRVPAVQAVHQEQLGIVPAFEGEEIVEGLHLNQGENRLTIKVRNAGGAFSFSARFCDSEGEALPGLTYTLSSTQAIPRDGYWQLR